MSTTADIFRSTVRSSLQLKKKTTTSAHIAIVLLLWLLAFFFAKTSGEGDSIQRSFLRIGVHCANAHVVRALLSSLERVIQDLEVETELSRSRLILILTSSVLEIESFEFYLQNLPLDIL